MDISSFSKDELDILNELAGSGYDEGFYINFFNQFEAKEGLNLLTRPGHSLQHQFSIYLENQFKEYYEEETINNFNRKLAMRFYGFGELREYLAPDWYTDTFLHWLKPQIEMVLKKPNGEIPDEYVAQSMKRLAELVSLNLNRKVLPFIGAGVSANYGFPTWGCFLKELSENTTKKDFIHNLIDEGKFELAGDEILKCMGERGFYEKFTLIFKVYPSIDGHLTSLSNFNSNGVITTNYDEIVERMFNMGINFSARSSEEFTQHHIKGKLSSSNISNFIGYIEEGHRLLLKLHGDLDTHEDRILSREDYNKAYGENGEIDFSLPLPAGISELYGKYNFLFVGCSLLDDRTMELFKLIKFDLSHQHYAFLKWQGEEKAKERERFLNDRGIFPIYYRADDNGGHGFLGLLTQYATADIQLMLMNHPTWMHAIASDDPNYVI